MKARNYVALLVGLQLLFSLPLAAQAIYRPLPDSVEFAAPFAPQEVCTPTSTTICLSDNRFAVSATYRTNTQTGSGQGVRLTSDTGYFTFFSATNVEVVVKVLNACTFNSRFWVFAGGLTDVNVVLTVRDTVSGTVKTYTNPTGTPFQPIQDTSAFATCNAGSGSTFTNGSSTLVGSQAIGANGGTLTVAAAGTTLDGAKITFPTGALTGNANVTVSLNRGTVTPIAGTYSGAALDLNISGASSTFSQPVSITLRNTGPANTVPVPYFVDSGGKLRPGQLIAVDRQAGTFTFQTFHASLFTWLFGSTATPIDPVTTTYTPGADGFQVVNVATTYNREGECFGMTAFSLWYFLNQRSNGALYSRFMNVVGTDSNNQPIRGQNVIATRAFTSIAQKWTTYYPDVVRRQQQLTQADRVASIRNMMANTAAPVLIYLYHSDGTAGGHSVLAYGIDSTGKISIYDPNFPNTTRTIQYSTASNSFAQYCSGACYDGIVYSGDGSLLINEPYSNILADAQNNFNNSGGATIDITSHTNGQAVTSRFATLAGVVHSGQLLVTKLTILVNSTEYSADIPLSGAYSIPVALTDGVNYIRFRTEGKDNRGNLQETTNNRTTDFILRAVVPSSVILMTLTWDKNDTDLDTYVIDPNGDYSAYYHKVTSDGGELDRDVTTGYGPEHWTLTNTDVVRYTRPYRFRVHYYSDHGNGPTNYTVTIELYNGTSRQVTYTYRGALSSHSTVNDGPLGVGSDWADIATIIPTQSASAGPVAQEAPDGSVTITVPVPSPEERRKQKQ